MVNHTMRCFNILAALLVSAGLASCRNVPGAGQAQADYEPGMSLSYCSGKDIPTEAQLAEIRDAGFKWVEVVMNPFSSRYCDESESSPRAYEEKARIERAGLKVWSCHLPYSKLIDVSLTDDAAREKALLEDEKMIELAAIFSPQRIVLHPSAEPIADDDRTARLKCSAASIIRLSAAAKKIGAVLCVEDLPRTCLGKNSDEIMYLIRECPDAMVCFDSNHLLQETHDSFFRAVWSRIGTIHASDYDRQDERHWVEGAGVIDWPAFLKNLKKTGYEGVFMHEVRSGENLTPAVIMEAYRKVVLQQQ